MPPHSTTAAAAAVEGYGEEKEDVDATLELTPAFKLRYTGFGIDLVRLLRLPGPLPMYKHFTPRPPWQIRDAVLKSARVRSAVQRSADERGVAASFVRIEAEAIINTMGHELGVNAIRALGYFLHKVLCAVYSEVRVDPADLEAVKQAVKRGPVLILPNHRSYMDFLIVSYIFFFAGVPVPAIAAGQDFLSMGPITALLRRCGAFFMRRSFKDDPLYWACFSEYVQSIVSFGDQPLEFFIEGTRSRTGKALHPKVGLFGVSLRPYFDCHAPDITLVPVSITYEERMETHSYVKEMLGTPKTKESVGALIQARSVMQHNCGRMHIKVGPCISTRAELEGKISRQRHRESPGPTPFSDGEKAAVLDLAYKVIATHQEHFVITVPSMLSALVLYWSYMHGSSTATVDAVVDACERVCREVLRRGYRIDVQPRDATDTVSSIRGGLAAGLPGWLNPLHPAAVIAGPVLDFSGAMPTKYIVDLDSLPHDPVFGTILLGHQRNEIVHVFAAEALAVAAVLTAGACSAAASKTSAYAEFRYLHDLLEIEFILRWKTDEDARAAFDAALDRLTLSGALTVDCDTITLTGDWFVTFLASMILPFVLSSTVVAEWWLANPTARLNLDSRSERGGPPLGLDIIRAHVANDHNITFGQVCGECLSSDILKNTVGRLRTWGVVTTDAKNVATLKSVDRLVKINGRTRRAAAAITTAVRGASVVGAKM